MKYKYKTIKLFARFIITALGYLCSQTTETMSIKSLDNNLHPYYWKSPRLIFSPFPTAPLSIVQPLDSVSTVKNIVNLNIGYKQLVITLSDDFKTINISELINGEERLYPFRSSLDWYVKQLYKQIWKNKYLEIMLKDSKDSDKRRSGQMLELVGVDMGRLEELHCR